MIFAQCQAMVGIHVIPLHGLVIIAWLHLASFADIFQLLAIRVPWKAQTLYIFLRQQHSYSFYSCHIIIS